MENFWQENIALTLMSRMSQVFFRLADKLTSNQQKFIAEVIDTFIVVPLMATTLLDNKLEQLRTIDGLAKIKF